MTSIVAWLDRIYIKAKENLRCLHAFACVYVIPLWPTSSSQYSLLYNRTGILKTRSSRVSTDDIRQVMRQAFVCKILYFKLPGGTENSCEIWIECVRKGEEEKVRHKNIGKNMTEFPFSDSDDVQIRDQQNIKVTVSGGVKMRARNQKPICMTFWSMSDTTHVRVAVVKYREFLGQYFADVDISFDRRSIKCQIDPWGKILKLEKAPKHQCQWNSKSYFSLTLF